MFQINGVLERYKNVVYLLSSATADLTANLSTSQLDGKSS